MSFSITCQLTINTQGLFLNGEKDTIVPGFDDIREGLTTAYKSLDIDYPKFHKMDNLSKLAFLGVEILKEKVDLIKYGENDIALVFQNSYSSLDTDVKHQEKIDEEDKQPSPAIFVYTLPNILMGEIAIRNKWFGENLFLLTESFDLEQWQRSVETLLALNKAKAVIGGWVEVFDKHCDLQLYFAEKD